MQIFRVYRALARGPLDYEIADGDYPYESVRYKIATRKQSNNSPKGFHISYEEKPRIIWEQPLKIHYGNPEYREINHAKELEQ